MDTEVHLEPRGLGSPEGYELLKIMDNTIAIYRNLSHRAAHELVSDSQIDELCRAPDNGTTHMDKEQEHAAFDDALEKLETELFHISDASNRQLYFKNLRQETDIFLLFANWTEQQRQKLIDPRLRNASVWNEVCLTKEMACAELRDLIGVFRMMKFPPVTATLQGATPEATENLRRKCRQMILFPAMNNTNAENDLDEALYCVEKRRIHVEAIRKSAELTALTLRSGIKEQMAFLFLLEKLMTKWNVVKIPYETQVFSASDSNYPYRGEFWIEFMSIPPDCWGFDILEDPKMNMAPYLWQAADDAGYRPRFDEAASEGESDQPQEINPEVASNNVTLIFSLNFVQQDTLSDWKEKRVRRRFGLPHFCAPPVPTSSPFEASWCEFFVTSKSDEEKLPAYASKIILGKETDFRVAEVDTGDEGGINIIARLNGDMGACVQNEKQISCEISIKSISWFENVALPCQTTPARSFNWVNKSTENQAQTLKDCGFANAKVLAAEQIAKDSFESVDEFLMIVQRTCLDRAIFAIVQAQATRILREMTYPLIDDESIEAVADNLKRFPNLNVKILENLMLIISRGNSSEIEFEVPPTKPSGYHIPNSMATWAFDFNCYVCIPKQITIVFSDSDNIAFTMKDIPILIRNSQGRPDKIMGVTDVLVTISFANKNCHIKQTFSTDPREQAFNRRLRTLELLTVCKLRQLVLEALKPQASIFPSLLFDLYRTSLPRTRTMNGAMLLNDYQTWLLTQISMALLPEKHNGIAETRNAPPNESVDDKPPTLYNQPSAPYYEGYAPSNLVQENGSQDAAAQARGYSHHTQPIVGSSTTGAKSYSDHQAAFRASGMMPPHHGESSFPDTSSYLGTNRFISDSLPRVE